MAAHERVIASCADLANSGDGIRFVLEQDGDAVQAFAVRYRGGVYAYLNSCPHRGSELDWLPGVFFDSDAATLVCSLHGARFEPDTGRCVEGPCRGGRLVKLAVRERAGDGAVVIDGRGTVPAGE